MLQNNVLPWACLAMIFFLCFKLLHLFFIKFVNDSWAIMCGSFQRLKQKLNQVDSTLTYTIPIATMNIWIIIITRMWANACFRFGIIFFLFFPLLSFPDWWLFPVLKSFLDPILTFLIGARVKKRNDSRKMFCPNDFI